MSGLLYRHLRWTETLSVALGKGKYKNTDAGLCKECSIAQVPDSELCEGCRIHWIVTIQFSDDLRAAISLSFAVLGCIGSGLVFWLYRVEDEGGPVMIEIGNFLSSYIPEHVKHNSVLESNIEIILITSFLIWLSIALALICFSSWDRTWKRRLPFWLSVILGIIVCTWGGLKFFEYSWIVWPQVMGFHYLGSVYWSRCLRWRARDGAQEGKEEVVEVRVEERQDVVRGDKIV